MARTTQQIFDDMLTRKNAEPDLAGLTSSSQSALWRLIFWVAAQSINLFEQIMDALKAEVTTVAENSIAGSAQWLQQKALEFQYDETDPQVIQIIDGVPQYPTVDPSKRIIKNASVKEGSNRIVFIKVAKDDGSGGLTPLTTNELNAFKGYIQKIGFAGIPYVSQSEQADRCQFTGEFFYGGQFVASNVKAAVIESIKTYLNSLPFDGVIEFNKVIDAIQATEGVVDVDTLNAVLRIRGFSISADDPRVITVERTAETSAGYIIEEDTAGFTFNDTITATLNQ